MPPPIKDPAAELRAHWNDARARHAGRRKQFDQLLDAVAKGFADLDMGLTGVEVNGATLIDLTDEREDPAPPHVAHAQHHWAALCQNQPVFVLSMSSFSSALNKSIGAFNRTDAAEAVDVDAITRAAPSARVYTSETAPWPDVLHGHVLVVVAGTTERDALFALGLGLLHPTFLARHGRDGLVGLRVSVLGPLAADFPLRVAAERRAQRTIEKHDADFGSAADMVRVGKTMLTLLAELEGMGGSQPLLQAFPPEKMIAALTPYAAAKATRAQLVKDHDRARRDRSKAHHGWDGAPPAGQDLETWAGAAALPEHGTAYKTPGRGPR